MKEITWISREQDRIDLCVEDFKNKIGKKLSFRKCMSKIRSSMEYAMRRKQKKRLEGRRRTTMKAAPWVDNELLTNIRYRS